VLFSTTDGQNAPIIVPQIFLHHHPIHFADSHALKVIYRFHRFTRIPCAGYLLANLAPLREVVPVKIWKWESRNLPSVTHSIRTAIAATVSLAVARLLGLPEAYWAAIATLVVMQSTLGATLLISIERIAATALGALGGALLANYFSGNLLVFAAAVFGLGLACAAFRMEKTAYRYAGVTLAIIVLIPRSNAPWVVALHRFVEVSVGIIVALALVAVWPEHQPKTLKSVE
jgi:uncharacterized membrane protein YccC